MSADQHPPAPPAGPRHIAAERRDAWTRYWASGALHSCAGSFAGNYSGAIRAFWEGVFSSLAGQARVLDLCCGNAPLAQLLLELRSEAGVVVDAVDMALVAPDWVDELPPAERERVRIHSGVDVAALPFDDASMDLCTSQYGIEYVGEAAVAEACRVLRPRGRFAAVLHHVDSLPVRIAREDLGHLAWLQCEGGLFDATRAMLRPMAISATAQGREQLNRDADASAARDRFNALQRELDVRAGAARWPDALQDARDACAAVLQQAREQGEAAAAGTLARVREDVAALALRDRELVDSALDRAALEALLAPLRDLQVDVLCFDTGDIAGWAANGTAQ